MEKLVQKHRKQLRHVILDAVRERSRVRRRRCLACSRISSSPEFTTTRGTRDGPSTSAGVMYPPQARGPLTACRFTIKHSREIIVGVGPNTYECNPSAFADTLNKVTSTRGVSLGARLAPRFYQRSPVPRVGRLRSASAAPLHYSIPRYPLPARTNAYPFNSSAPRDSFLKLNTNPGPGSYNICVSRDRRIPYSEHLGSGRTMVPAVLVDCTPVSSAKCDGCGEAPRGDFWRSPARTLCRPCMEETFPQRMHESTPSSARAPFRKVRLCNEVHSHEGTTAAIRLRTEKQQQRTCAREAYLSMYFN